MSIKKTITLIIFIITTNSAFSQSAKIDDMLQELSEEKNDSTRIDLILHYFANTAEYDPLLDMQNAEKLLQQSQKDNDRIAESLAFALLGYDYKAIGRIAKSLEYTLKATAIAQKTDNEKLIATIKIWLAVDYKSLEDYSKTVNLLLSAEKSTSNLKEYEIQITACENLAEVYLLMNKIDSALIYAQRDYELCMRIHYYDYLAYTLLNLGTIHGKLGNSSLAIGYFNMALKESIKIKSAKLISMTYNAIAEYYHNINRNDSCTIYARKAITIIQKTPFANYSIKPAKLLLDIYKETNSDSALKYSEIYRIANDSLFSAKTIQQTQLMTFEDELRQQQLFSEKTKAEEQRKQNLQYVLIALGIITFIILFLLLSRSFITNTRLIEFLGVMALLIVFEFLNLLLHPFLERVTNHTPLVMLLALVCVASLLIPLHRRVEKWSTSKLVEKNKKIRLANAKKTIEKLEGKADSI